VLVAAAVDQDQRLLLALGLDHEVPPAVPPGAMLPAAIEIRSKSSTRAWLAIECASFSFCEASIELDTPPPIDCAALSKGVADSQSARREQELRNGSPNSARASGNAWQISN